MCQHLTVAENMFLGREIKKGRKLDNKTMNQKAKEQLESLGIRDLKPTTTMSELPVGRQQMVEIAKALMLNATVAGQIYCLYQSPSAGITAYRRHSHDHA